MKKFDNDKFNKFLKEKTELALEVIKSLRLRVFVVIVVVGILPLFLIGELIMGPIEDSMIEIRKERLQKQFSTIKNHILSEKYMDVQNSAKVNAELSQLSLMYDGRVMVVDSNFVIIKDTYNIDVNKTTISQDVIKCFNGSTIFKYSKKKNSLKLDLPITDENGNILGVLEATFSTKDIRSALNSIQEKIIFIESILTLAILVFAFFWVKHLISPFNKIERQFEKTASGYLDGKMSLDGYTENKKIALAFNRTLERMNKLDESRQEFVSNVSHELKTPMTSIKVLADSLLMQENVPAEIYREFFMDIRNEIDRENDIISDLLTLVRMDKKSSGMNIERIDINTLLESVLKRLTPIAEQKNIELIMESYREVEADVDKVKISGAISNLVENAIKYNVDDGWVRVTLNADHKFFYLKVADSGIGIPLESQELIFERFYRVDKARARATGGTGLGLAITRKSIHMHNGDINIQSKEGEGTTFTVRIPLIYVGEKNAVSAGKEKVNDEET